MDAFKDSVCFRLKLLRVLETAGQKVLTYILQCGTVGKSPTEPLTDYLENLTSSSTAQYAALDGEKRSKAFNDTEKQHFSRDTSCSSFDITLLAKTIGLACEGLQDPKETTLSLVTKIKGIRNDVVHETHSNITEGEFLERLVNLQKLFVETLEATKVKYSTDGAEYDKKKQEVIQLVDEIKTKILSEEEILQTSPILLPQFKQDAFEELRQKLCSTEATFLKPLRFLSGYEDRRVQVQDIFANIIIKEDKEMDKTDPSLDPLTPAGGEKEERKRDKTIHHLQLLTLAENDSGPPAPHLLAVEGDAGSGKTTLLTYVLSEYLKEERDRKMKGLDNYNLLLWVVCREESSHTLEDLVKSLLSDASMKYGNLLIPLLKRSNVLILTDGLDEQNDSSRKLIGDILNQCQYCPNITLLSTSRPEGMQAMKTNAPKNFVLSHLKLEGVSIDERAALALRHYRWLCGSVPRDEARLKQVMHEVCWKELFRLPLNLLFLATIFYNEPQKLTTTITQAELYQKVLDWCVEKFLQRLEGRPQVPSRVFLKGTIASFLDKCYEIALKGLIQERIYLSAEDLCHLARICRDGGLQEQEVLSTFYSLRRETTGGVTEENYYVPHKGLQDFFAARHVLGRLDKYKQGDIRCVLQDSVPGQDLQLEPLRNMICHVLGLLSRQTDPMVPAMEETVDLLQESGMKDADDWLSTLADTEVHLDTMRRIASYINGYGYGDRAICVRDGTAHIASTLMPHIHRSEVSIELMSDGTHIEALIPTLGDHIFFQLTLVHHFRHPSLAPSSSHILQRVPRTDLTEFMGHLEAVHLTLLPSSLVLLSLAVADGGDTHALLQALKDIRSKIPDLLGLEVHVPVSAVASGPLTSLPDVPDVTLLLSGVSDDEVEAAIDATAALCPKKDGYTRLKFPEASMGADGCTKLIKGMAEAGVAVRHGILFPDTAKYHRGLFTLADRRLTRSGLFRLPEEELWRQG